MQLQSMRTRGVRFVFLLGIAAAAACGDVAGSPAVARVDVTPAQAQLWAGDTVRLTAVPRDAGGGALGNSVTWSSSSAAVATVDGTGKVTAVGPGQATLTAAAGGREGNVALTVSAYDLVYEARTGATPELVILAMEGGLPVRVRAPGAGWASDPAPSPDGTRIAFVVWDAENETSDVWVVGRDGSGLARLTDDTEIDDQPAWSPDGTRIAWRSYAAQRLGDIWVMNADGSGKRQVTLDPLPGVTEDLRPAWSPDGQHIVYASMLFDEADLYVIHNAGGNARRLTEGPNHDTEPAWSPDGTRIAFRRNFAGGSDVMLVAAQGGTPVRIELPSFQRMPAWSPDGRLLAFAEGASPSDVPQVYTMRPDGSQVTRRTETAWGGGSNPSFIRRP